MHNFRKQLERAVSSENVRYGELMSKHTTFCIGGAADYYVTPESAEMVQDTVRICRKQEIPYYVIGNGSNLLVSDDGYQGVIIEIGHKMAQLAVSEDGTVKAQAGISLAGLAKAAADRGLSGLEFASGIPGNLGGAVTMNAGAYGGEIRQVISGALILDGMDEIRFLTKEELKLGYRKSIIQEEGYIVLEAFFTLTEGEKETILQTMHGLNERRRKKQPLTVPSAGSTFKRPEGYFAGKLIEDTGLKGFQVGGAEVSEKHSGFVINANHATAEDVKTLIREVDRRVYEKFGVHLEPEVRML